MSKKTALETLKSCGLYGNYYDTIEKAADGVKSIIYELRGMLRHPPHDVQCAVLANMGIEGFVNNGASATHRIVPIASDENADIADIATCPEIYDWRNLDGSCDACEPFDRERITRMKKDLDYHISWRRGAETEMPNPTDLGILLDEISLVLFKISAETPE